MSNFRSLLCNAHVVKVPLAEVLMTSPTFRPILCDPFMYAKWRSSVRGWDSQDKLCIAYDLYL